MDKDFKTMPTRPQPNTWITPLVFSLGGVGAAIGYFQFSNQSDTTAAFVGASALLLSASLVSICNVVRNYRLSKRLASKSLSMELHEKALSEHTLVMVTDRDGTLTAVNRKFCDTFKYEPNEVIGQSVWELLSIPADRTANMELMDKIADGQVWSGIQRLRGKGEQSISVQSTIFPKLDDFGRFKEFVFVSTDMSSAMTQIAEKGRNDIVDALPDGVCIYDPSTFKITYANAAFRERVGWEKDGLDEKSISSLFTEAQRLKFQRHLGPLMKNESSQAVFEIEDDLGSVEVLTNVVESIDGQHNLLSVIRDMSGRKREEQLKLSSVSTVSHELRTPLTSIKGALRLLESGVMGKLQPEVGKLVGVAHRNSERLLAIVNDILTLEKLHAGELTISVQDIDLRDLLNEAADANAPFAAECEIAFEVETAQEPAFVRADPDRLMQVMSNLMSNAAKLSPPGENVTLSVVDGDAFWRVCVTDKGPGIPPHAREKLFDSFIQVDEENSKKLPSTGLGLTICREVIEQHGGLISFDTEVGVGTTFYFELEKSTQPRALQDVQNVA